MKFKFMNKIKKIGFVLAAVVIAAVSVPGNVYAEEETPVAVGDPAPATSTDKDNAKADLANYKVSQVTAYSLSDDGNKKLENILTAANTYIDNTSFTTVTLDEYVANIKSEMHASALASSAATTDTKKEDNKKEQKTDTANTNSNNTSTQASADDNSGKIDDNDRFNADADMKNYMESMQIQFTLNDTQYKKLHDLFDSAVYYIAYTEMTKNQLETYVASIKSEMYKTASSDVTSVTSEYLQVADNWDTPTVSYGQSVSIVLPIINLGTEELNDLVIEPVVTTDVKTWPFVPDSTGYVQTEPFIPGYVSLDNAMQNRREFTYRFKVREDVMSGYYELKFKVSYTRAGVRVEDDNAAILSVYVHTIGKPESGTIGGNGNEDKVPKSKIIVTGYDIDKEKVYSGDTFNLTIHVQNTSSTTSVSNILFGLSAAQETVGSGTTSDSITPFLPTSGSNSVYVASIAPGATSDLVIEMSAKAGLSQKSYVLDLSMSYDSGTQFDLTDKASISIPVYQESKFDISTPEVAPSSIDVGSQSNVMFSIYNTGKTSLFNTQVQFVGDSIEQNMAFVGNLASGSTGNVDVMLTGISPTMDDGTIRMIITYEDEAGNVTEVEKTCTLFVNQVMTDEDFGMDDSESGNRREPGAGGEEEVKAGGNSLLRIILIVVALLLVIGGIVAAVTIKKKKNASARHAEDLKDLEEIKDLDDPE